MKAQSGFTLIELVVTMLIISILAAIAYPSYSQYVARTKRKAAEACLSSYATYMERLYTTNLSYAAAATTWPSLDCASTQSADYTFSLMTTPAVSQSTYSIQAVPQSAQAIRDSLCGTLMLDQAGTRSVSTTASLSQCW